MKAFTQILIHVLLGTCLSTLISSHPACVSEAVTDIETTSAAEIVEPAEPETEAASSVLFVDSMTTDWQKPCWLK